MIGTTFDVDVIAAGERKVLSFSDGTVILQHNEPGYCAYIIKRGSVVIRKEGRTLETLEAGEIFGEMALIDYQPRAASAIASGYVELIPIDKAMFEVLVRDDPDFAMTVMRLMARRLRATMDLLDRAADDLPARSEVDRFERASA